MKIVYICNELNLNHGWGVVNYYTVMNSLPFFNEVIVITLKNANNLRISHSGNLKVLPILTSMTDSIFKSGLVIMDKVNIKKNLKIDTIDLVHVLVEPLIPLLDIFKKSNKIFSIVGTYSDFPFRVGFNKFLYRKSLKNVNKIVSISEYTAKRFNNIYGQDISTISLGVDLNNFKYYGISLARERAFVYLGFIKPRKGLIYALEAFKNIMSKDDSVLLYIIAGESNGKYADACFNYIKKNKMNKQVVFLGKLDKNEVIEIFNKSICNILPSVNEGAAFEGFGLIHLEANACGIPSIGSLDCGNESAIINGKTGFLCKQRDVSSIQKSMESILRDFDNKNFEVWQKESMLHAKQNDWKHYFNRMKTTVYEI
jgi:glycosyltransferase involved in cell wall biosynthesis